MSLLIRKKYNLIPGPTMHSPSVNKACSPFTSESSTPSRRPFTPVFRYAPKNVDRRGSSYSLDFALTSQRSERPTSNRYTASLVIMSVANGPVVPRFLCLCPALAALSCIKNHPGQQARSNTNTNIISI